MIRGPLSPTEKEYFMGIKRLSLVLALTLGVLGAGPALAQAPAQDQTQAQTQAQDPAQAKKLNQAPAQGKILLLESDHSAEEAKASLQGGSHDRGDNSHGGPSSGFGGMGPSHGGGPSPHR
jgi:hypothetical protein